MLPCAHMGSIADGPDSGYTVVVHMEEFVNIE
jgi:hypothetical protein